METPASQDSNDGREERGGPVRHENKVCFSFQGCHAPRRRVDGVDPEIGIIAKEQKAQKFPVVLA